ncbi:MAG: phosphoglycerate kinase, partial [Thermosphaera sp.]
MTINIPRLPTIKDLEINGKKILMRIDINSPIDPETEEIMDDKRISVHGKHVKE